MQVYESIVRGLESLGVTTAFGGNGENIASLALALGDGQDFRTCGAFGPMDVHTNGAIGLKAAQPHRTVVVALHGVWEQLEQRLRGT